MPQVHIASFILHAPPDALAGIIERAHALTEVEIVACDARGKLVLLIEAEHERRIVEIIDALRGIPAVLSASMVEHHVDDASEMSSMMLEEMPQ